MWARDAVLKLARLDAGGVAVACALPGGGKSRAVQAASAYWPRIVVFDPTARRGRLNWARGERRRRPWPGELVTPEALLADPSMLDRGHMRLVVGPERLEGPYLAGAFSAVARAVWRTGGVVLVAEELALYGRAALDAIVLCSAMGAHGGTPLVLVCQSMGRVPKDGRRHVSLVIAGPQAEPTDLEDLRGRCGVDFARRVAALKPPDPDTGTPGDEPIAWRVGEGVS